MSKQMSDQEKAIIFATCGELEGILAGISQKHELKVVPAFLWDDLLTTLKALKERLNELEELTETQQNNLEVYERVLADTKKAFSATDPGLLMVGDQEIVIPGVNGPRPEHAHLDRDTMGSVQRSMVHKNRARVLSHAGPPHPHPHNPHHKKRGK